MKYLTQNDILSVFGGELSSECHDIFEILFKKIMLGEITSHYALGVVLTSDCNIVDLKYPLINVNTAIYNINSIT